jgi:hypothetical protein
MLIANVNQITNTIITYPIEDIRSLFTSISFPIVITAGDLPDGFVEVTPSDKPEITTKTKVAKEYPPVFNGGKWCQVWGVVDSEITLEELQKEQIMMVTKAYIDEIEVGFSFTTEAGDTSVYQCREIDVQNMLKVQASVLAGVTLPDDFYWVNINNERVTPFTSNDVSNLIKGAYAFNYPLWGKLQSLKAKIRSADIYEVESVVW